jgi:hypothetical protein
LQDLEFAAAAYLTVEPATLRNPQLAIGWALRGAAITHRKSPEALLQLSEAYRADGQSAPAVSVAREGLSLLPVKRTVKGQSRIRRLLERAGSDAEPRP